MQQQVSLVDMMRELNSKGLNIAELANISGLPERDVRQMIKKGVKLPLNRIREATKRLMPTWKSAQGDSYFLKV